MSITDALAAKRTQEPEPAPEPPAEKAPRDGTEYVVLQLSSHESISTAEAEAAKHTSWAVIAIAHATSAQGAIHMAVDNGHAPPGTYVAVPARSWKPVKVSVEQVSRVKLEQA